MHSHSFHLHFSSPHLLSIFSWEAFQFILFQRNQIPSPFYQLEKLAQRDVTTITLSNLEMKKMKEIVQNGQMLQNQLEQLITLPQHLLPSTIVFILGSSILTPKEIFLFHFSPSTISSESEKISTIQEMSRKFIRELVQITSELRDASELGQTKVHILIQAQRQLPFDFLIPKQNFEIKLQKCSSVVKIDIISDVDNSQIQTDPQDLIELIWYQVGNSISGYYVN